MIGVGHMLGVDVGTKKQGSKGDTWASSHLDVVGNDGLSLGSPSGKSPWNSVETIITLKQTNIAMEIHGFPEEIIFNWWIFHMFGGGH